MRPNTLVRIPVMLLLGIGLAVAPGSPAVERIVPVDEPVASTSLPVVKKWKPAEVRMMKWINRERIKRGIAPVKFRKTLGYLGRKHSRKMRAAGEIFHSSLGNTVSDLRWRVAGENVGVGPTAGGLHRAFMASPGHKANVLARGYNRVGVGLVKSSGGIIWVTVLFLG